jgi:hypothetical protein
LENALGLGQFQAPTYLTLRTRQIAPIWKSAFSGNPSNLHINYEAQLAEVSTYLLNGTTLCGTSCGNEAYQLGVGTDYSVSPNQPAQFITNIGEAPYYGGEILTSGNYGGTYGTWSATNSSVASNVLTVSGTVTGTIYPQQGS